MAKTTNCAFCAKELKKGLFTGEDYMLDLNTEFITCCKDCYSRYEQAAARNKKRFSTKMKNYRTATGKKVDDATVARMFLSYLEQEQAQIERCGTGDPHANFGYFAADGNGLFTVREFNLEADSSINKMAKSTKNADKVGEVRFDKHDISRMEYRTTAFGESTGLFSTAFSFVIRLNDEKEITYKPCITKMTFIGKGLWPHTQKRKAKQQCVETLQTLQQIIGSDLPIVEVKKFK